jgi:hypothetical protein
LYDSASPYVNLMAWANGVPMPIDVQPSVGRGGAWSWDGNYYAHPQDAAPYVSLYRNSGTRMVKLADPVVINGDIGWSAAFNRAGTHLAVGMRGDGASVSYVKIFERSGDTFTNVTGLVDATPSGGLYRATGLSYNNDGTLLAVATNTNPGLSLYTVVGNTYTKVSNIGVTPSGIGDSCAFSPNGALLAFLHNTSLANAPLTVYSVSGQTLTIAFQNFADPTPQGCVWSPDGAYLAVVFAGLNVVYSVDGSTLTEVFREGNLGNGNAMPVFTDTHLLVAYERFNGAAPSRFRAFALDTWSYDAAASLSLTDNNLALTQWGSAGVTVLR